MQPVPHSTVTSLLDLQFTICSSITGRRKIYNLQFHYWQEKNSLSSTMPETRPLDGLIPGGRNELNKKICYDKN